MAVLSIMVAAALAGGSDRANGTRLVEAPDGAIELRAFARVEGSTFDVTWRVSVTSAVAGATVSFYESVDGTTIGPITLDGVALQCVKSSFRTSCGLGAIAPEAPLTVVERIRLPDYPMTTAEADVAVAGDANPRNSHAMVRLGSHGWETVDQGGEADLRLLGSVEPANPSAGDTLVWRLQIVDLNGVPSQGTLINFHAPDGTVVLSEKTDRGPGCYFSPPQAHICVLNLLTAAAPTGNLTIETTAPSAGTYTLEAGAGGAQPDPVQSNNVLALTTTVSPPPSSPAPPPEQPSPTTPTEPAGDMPPSSSAKNNVPSRRTLVGTAFSDILRGHRGPDRLFGMGGNDRLLAGRGNDFLHGGSGRDYLDGGPGNDTINSRDGTRDVIKCGPGKDNVRNDRSDIVARDCEIVAN